MSCFFANAFIMINLMWIIPSPQSLTGMSDFDECRHMAIVGCEMVEECTVDTVREEKFEVCFERALKRCNKLKGS